MTGLELPTPVNSC